jgi:hypothetical protein
MIKIHIKLPSYYYHGRRLFHIMYTEHLHNFIYHKEISLKALDYSSGGLDNLYHISLNQMQ